MALAHKDDSPPDPREQQRLDRLGKEEPDFRADPTALTTDALHREIAQLRQLVETEIQSLDRLVLSQFALVEQQRIEQKADTKAAVDAALTAQKEAVKEQTIASERAIQKSETATAKQLEQLGASFSASVEQLRVNVDELKTRLGSIESVKIGHTEAKAGISGGVALITTVIGSAIGIVGFVAFLLSTSP